MKPHEERVIAEKTELGIKLQKLSQFLESDKVCELDDIDIRLLETQLCIMQSYVHILEFRISRFES